MCDAHVLASSKTPAFNLSGADWKRTVLYLQNVSVQQAPVLNLLGAKCERDSAAAPTA